MFFLSKEDIKKILPMRDAITIVKEAFKLYSQGKSKVPLRQFINIPKFHARTVYMPSYIEDLDMGGVKIVSLFPQNIAKNKPMLQSTMILINEQTGEVCSVLDGTYLTQLRTGAAQGAATERLARENAKVGVLIGAGAQALMQLEAMLTVRDFAKILIFDLDHNKSNELVNKAKCELKSSNTEIISVSNINQFIALADVITTVTTSKTPVFKGSLVKRGTHINGVGSFTPEMQEIDEYLIKKANKIFVDSKEAVLSEAGDFLIPMKQKKIKANIINGEIGEVFLDIKIGRQNPDEITFFKTVGVAVEDLVVAVEIYKRAMELGLGKELKMDYR